MPPDGEPRPSDKERVAVVRWIELALRDAVNARPAQTPLARRLTNFEYENIVRDLLGFELKLIDDLPKDPVKPYHFNNTAEFMQMEPEQIDRYLECARRAMASAIVDPAKPEIHKSRREWKAYGLDRGLGADEISPWGNRRNTPAWGMGLKSFPRTGEYRIRVKASAIFPPGITELPLRLVMGYELNVNSATQQIEPVGTVRLKNSPDDPQVFEFRGRIENHPAQPGRVVNGQRRPDTMTITPQNLYDDGTLNDGRRDLAMSRAVVEWIEFEAKLKAAEQGDVVAQNNLGLMHATGIGVSRDDIESYVWFLVAAATGHRRAKKSLAKAQLTPEQLATAEERAAELLEQINANKAK